MGGVSYWRRLKPTLLKTKTRFHRTAPSINAIHQLLGVCYLLGDADFADGDVVFLLPFLV
jgi:hypothetical protein